MSMFIDFAPVKDCKSQSETYGEICIRCNKCGRFDEGGVNNPIRSDIKIISQFNPTIPPFWEYPKQHGYFYKSKWVAERQSKSSTFEREGNLIDILPPAWKAKDRLEYHRWWIEGRNY